MSQIRKIMFKQIFPVLKALEKYLAACLKVVLRTKDIARRGFPNSPLSCGRYIQALSVPMIFCAAYPAS